VTSRRSRVRRRLLPWLLLAASSASADLSSQLEDCAAEAAEDEYLLLPVTEACPDAARTIDAGEWESLLEEDWRDTLSYRDATQLEDLIAYYAENGRSGDAFDLGALDGIVDGLQQPATDEARSLFQRFVDWLRDLIGAGDTADRDWFGEWWSGVDIPETAIRAIFLTLAGLIILAALAVVTLEVLAARRASPRWEPASLRAEPGALTAMRGRPVSLTDLEHAALRDKPAVLLELLLTRLDSAGLMARRPTFTHRELSRDGRQLGGDNAAVLARLADSAEILRYGGVAPDALRVDELVTDGVAMFRRLGGIGT